MRTQLWKHVLFVVLLIGLVHVSWATSPKSATIALAPVVPDSPSEPGVPSRPAGTAADVTRLENQASTQEVEGSQLQFAYVQVAHLAPFAVGAGTAVTVTLEGVTVPGLTNVKYGDCSPGYTMVPAGTFNVAIWASGSSTPIITEAVQLKANTYYTGIIYGDGANQDLGLLVLQDTVSAPAAGRFRIRLGHLAPFAAGDAPVDVRLAAGTPVLENIIFIEVTGFLEMVAGTYDFIITTPGGETTLIDPAPITVAAGDIISLFAAGDGDNQELGVFLLPRDGEGTFLPLKKTAYLQVAHLAPIGIDGGTAVTVTLNGLPVPELTNVRYGDSIGYLELGAGEYDVGIWTAGSSSAAVTTTIELLAETYYSAIAHGDGFHQELGLMLLQDDPSAPALSAFRIRTGHVAPFAAGTVTVDIRYADGTLLQTLDFGEAHSMELPAGSYDLIVTTPGGGTTLIDPDVISWVAGQIVSAFVTGDGNNQEPGVFVLPAGEEGFFLPLKAPVTYKCYLSLIVYNAVP